MSAAFTETGAQFDHTTNKRSLVATQQYALSHSEQKRKAIAFLLGWNSKVILLKNTPMEHQRLLLAMTEYLRELNVSLKHPLPYYFNDPARDQFSRAQAFAEETFQQLGAVNPEIADHFGAASNLLLILARSEHSTKANTAKLELLLTVLDIPIELKHVPDKGRLIWASAIRDYFASSLIQLELKGKRKAG